MPSPFPGMNPYLEQADIWPAFHRAFMTAAREEIAARLPPGYAALLKDHDYQRLVPDGFVVDPVATRAALSRPLGPREIIDHIGLLENVPVAFVELRTSDGGDVVTVIDLLDDSQKQPSPIRSDYIRRRQQLPYEPFAFVEIDLLRGGRRFPYPPELASDYVVLVSRPENRPKGDLWCVDLRDPLPHIPVPLRAPDPETALDLQGVLHRAYESLYDVSRIYDGQPEPALSPDDAEWAEQFVPTRT